jgi:hypothetical protein
MWNGTVGHLRRNAIAYLALFVALGGTAWAATKITGRDVANDSLTGRDIREKTLVKPVVKTFQDNNSVELHSTAPGAEIGSVQIRARAPGTLVAQLNVIFGGQGGGNDYPRCDIRADAGDETVFLGESSSRIFIPDTVYDEATLSMGGSAAVDKGSFVVHAYCDNASGGADINTQNRNLTVWYIPK